MYYLFYIIFPVNGLFLPLGNKALLLLKVSYHFEHLQYLRGLTLIEPPNEKSEWLRDSC